MIKRIRPVYLVESLSRLATENGGNELYDGDVSNNGATFMLKMCL
jgi:hypothetical protein